MKIALIVAAVLVGVFLLLRYFNLKRDKDDKNALEKAYLAKDYEKYLRIVNYRIEIAKEAKDKNLLATLKMPIYLEQRDWTKLKALYRQVDTKTLPKATKLTFLCHYITGLYISGESRLANEFVTKNSRFLKEGEGNSRYQIYLDGFKAYNAFYAGDLNGAEQRFTALKENKINNGFYQEVYDTFLEKIKEQREG